MAKSLGTFKVGDYFSFYADMPEYKGKLEDVRSQVRSSSDELIADLDVELDENVNGRYIFSAGNIDWKTGKYSLDIETVTDGRKASSETFTVSIIKDVTR